MCLFVVEVGEAGDGHCQRNLYVVHSHDSGSAFSSVIARAREDEIAYRNGDGELVQWVLAKVETLDYVGQKISDGQELYSEPRFDSPLNPYPFPLQPELSVPTSSGVTAMDNEME